MAEILFIASDPCIVDLVEELRQVVATPIELEADYTGGIKRIFESRPAVVFLQHKIGDLPCDKLASQINMLMEGETVPLVLLSDETGISFSVASTYSACFDLCLPLAELSWQVQQLLRTLPGISWLEPTVPQQQEPSAPEPATTGAEAALPAGAPGAVSPGEGIDLSVPYGEVDFSLPLPWSPGSTAPPDVSNLLNFEPGQLPELEHTALVPPAPSPEPTTPPDLTDFLAGAVEVAPEPDPHTFSIGAPILQDSAARPGAQRPYQDPTLFRESPAQAQPAAPPAPPAAKAAGGRKAAAEKPQVPPDQATPAGATTATSPATPTKEGNGEAGWSLNADDPTAAAVARLGAARSRSRLYGIVAVALALVVVGVAGVAYFGGTLNQDSPSGLASLDAALTRTAAGLPKQLPFIPEVAADPAYATGHPGWERYRADGVEYLVYREKSGIRAIQVLAEEQGALSPALLRVCLKLATGHEGFATKRIEEQNGMQITTGTLQNGGELLVYRSVPGQEIRGFVMSYPVLNPSSK